MSWVRVILPVPEFTERQRISEKTRLAFEVLMWGLITAIAPPSDLRGLILFTGVFVMIQHLFYCTRVWLYQRT